MSTVVLDHGYVELIETWGSDERIIEAARMSTAKGFQGWGGQYPCACVLRTGADPACKVCGGTGTTIGDEKLLRYLYEHRHHTPFEMAGMTIEVQAPIFVFREWHRHRTQSYNEMSARYVPLPDVHYIPTIDRTMNSMAGSNKQAQAHTDATLDATKHRQFLLRLQETYEHAERTYQFGLSIGIPKELARLPVPVARYSRMRASANLRNWLGFLSLRMDPAAQWEIRQYALAVSAIIQDKFPRTHQLFGEGLAK